MILFRLDNPHIVNGGIRQIWPDWPQERRLDPFASQDPDMARVSVQYADVDLLGGLGPDMARLELRWLMLSSLLCVCLRIWLQMCPSNRTSRSSFIFFVQFSISGNWTEKPSNFSSKGKLDEHFRPIFKACS